MRVKPATLRESSWRDEMTVGLIAMTWAQPLDGESENTVTS